MTARRNLVLGLGKTGVSVAKYLCAQGESVVVNDSRDLPPGREEIASLGHDVVACFGGFDARLLEGIDRIVLSPGVPRTEPIVEAALSAGMPVVGDIELFANDVEAPVVGITGTNGKSTVTTLVAEMVRASGRRVLAGGNLGRPALDLLVEETPDFYVLELSSYQLESTSQLALLAAAVLNVTADHMDRYPSLEAYAAAKARIYRNSKFAIFNADDPAVRSMDMGSAIGIGFTLRESGARFSAKRIAGELHLVRDDVPLIAVKELGVPGMHNAANALAALAMGTAMGLPEAPMLEVLKTFAGLEHRTQLVAEHRGVRYINDSKGTNVGATIAAVEGLGAPIVLIAGGDGKGQDFAPLAPAFRSRVRHAVLIGRDKDRIAAALAGVCEVEFAADMDHAVRAAARVAAPGDFVVLSPACASFDMYRDYMERGAAFADAARRITQ